MNARENIPDRSLGDYYCKICDSHMNSDDIWSTHIIGKRHIKNVSKGSSDSKYEDLNVESGLKYELQYALGPVVGLSYVQEFRRRDPRAPTYYNCHLCHAILPMPNLVIEHVTAMKHKLNYLKETDIKRYESIMDTHLGKELIIPLVEEACNDLEHRLGRGSVTVKIEKVKKMIPYTFTEEIEKHKTDPDYRRSRRRERSESRTRTYEHIKRSKSRSRSCRRTSSYERDSRTKSRSRSCRRTSPYECDSRTKSRSRSCRRTSYYERESRTKRRSSSRYASPHDHKKRTTRNRDEPSTSRKSSLENHRPKTKCHRKNCKKNPSYKHGTKSKRNHKSSHFSNDKDERETLTKPTTDIMVFTEEFDRKLHNIPANEFLQLALNKLDSFDMDGVDCSLLRELLNKIEVLLHSKLPDLFGGISDHGSPLGRSRDLYYPTAPETYGPMPPPMNYESDVSILSLIDMEKENYN